MPTIKGVLKIAATIFQTVQQIDNPILDARVLLGYIIDKPATYIYANPNKLLTEEEYINFQNLVKRRQKLEPVAYIIGHKEFYSHSFKINRQVLIPRPDSELLVEVALQQYQILRSTDNNVVNILELGVGSGCIIISILLEASQITALATDISTDALKVAAQNAALYNVQDRLHLLHSDWFDNIPQDQKFNIILSNPPYISTFEKDLVAPETLLHEPRRALFAANEGMGAYEIIARNAKYYLKKTGILILEVGFNQAEKVIKLFEGYDYRHRESAKDLQGIDRVIVFEINFDVQKI